MLTCQGNGDLCVFEDQQLLYNLTVVLRRGFQSFDPCNNDARPMPDVVEVRAVLAAAYVYILEFLCVVDMKYSELQNGNTE